MRAYADSATKARSTATEAVKHGKAPGAQSDKMGTKARQGEETVCLY